MSEIVIDVGYLQKYLRDIVRELNGIKFETTCFGMTGNISGLNAYVYAYSRISNFLVGYRSFARADIQNMCQCIEELINTDSELANTISGDSVELLVSLNNDIGSISDAEGALSLPSIYTSSYILNYEDMSRFNQIYTEQVSELLSHILGYRNWIEDLCDSGAIQGDMANAIISYWNEVHIPIVDVVSRIVLEIKDRYSDFVNEIDTLITEREDCNIPQCQLEGSMDEIYSLLNRIRLVSEGITGLVQSYYNSYSQFTSSNPNAELLIDMTERTISEIQVLDESIIDYENNQANIIKDYIDNAFNEINNLISGVQSVNQSEYVSGRASQISGYEYISSVLENTDAFFIERNIVDMYIDVANGDINNLSNSEIKFIQNYIDDIATNRYQGTANVLEVRNRYPDMDIISSYVQAYELLNPEQAIIVREFMLPISTAATDSNGYSQDIENILYILYTACEPYRTVYINAARHISMNNIYYNGLAHYDTSSRSIDLNIDELRNNSIPYLTFFHELGHSVDLIMPINYSYNTHFSSNPKFVNDDGKTLQDLVIEEISRNISETLEYIIETNSLILDDEEFQSIMGHIISQRYIQRDNYPSEWTQDMIQAFKSLRIYYGYHRYEYNEEGELNHRNRVTGILEESPLSDIFGAITNNEIGGRRGHYMDEDSELISAGMNPNVVYSDSELAYYLGNYTYWYTTDGVTINISSEFFAEYSAHCIYGTEGCAEIYNSITPSSSIFIDEFYQSLI